MLVVYSNKHLYIVKLSIMKHVSPTDYFPFRSMIAGFRLKAVALILLVVPFCTFRAAAEFEFNYIVNAATDELFPVNPPLAPVLFQSDFPEGFSFQLDPESVVSDPFQVQSAVYFIDGNRVRTENVYPYTLFGDNPNTGDYKGSPDDFPFGYHVITVKYYDHPRGRGNLLGEKSLAFFWLDVQGNELRIVSGTQTTEDIFWNDGPEAYDYDEIVGVSFPPGIVQAPATWQDGNNPVGIDARNLPEGEYDFSIILRIQFPGSFFREEIVIPIHLTVLPPTGGPRPQLETYSIYDADTDELFLELIFAGQPVRGSVEFFPDFFNLTVQPDMPVDFVRFEGTFRPCATCPVEEVINRTENFAPYAWFGDSRGNFSGRPIQVGIYEVRATPFKDGQAGIFEDIVLDVFDPDDFLRLTVFPNPFTTDLSVSVEEKERPQSVQLDLFDQSGNPVIRKRMGNGQAALPTDYLQPGVYFLRVSDATGRQRVVQVVKE